MTSATQLPAHSLVQPLSSEDEQILRQVMANTHQIINVLEHAKALGLDVSQHEARVAMHQHFCKTALEKFFPISLKPKTQADEQ